MFPVYTFSHVEESTGLAVYADLAYEPEVIHPIPPPPADLELLLQGTSYTVFQD